MSIMVSFQLAGIHYLIDETKKVFKDIDQLYLENNNIYSKLEGRFIKYRCYYVIIMIIILLFIIAELMQLYNGDRSFFYLIEPHNPWSLWLDIYNHLIEYLTVFLLATNLWMLFNISITLNGIEGEADKHTIKVDAFGISMKLEPLRNLNSKIIAYYFIIVALAIVSYITPFSIASYETILLILLLLIGVAFFLVGLAAIRRILNSKIECELEEINNKSQNCLRNILEIPQGLNHEELTKYININSDMLTVLHNERDERISLKKAWIDPVSIGAFIGSFIIPVITLVRMLI